MVLSSFLLLSFFLFLLVWSFFYLFSFWFFFLEFFLLCVRFPLSLFSYEKCFCAHVQTWPRRYRDHADHEPDDPGPGWEVRNEDSISARLSLRAVWTIRVRMRRLNSGLSVWRGLEPISKVMPRLRYRLVVCLSSLMDTACDQWSIRDHFGSGPIYRHVIRSRYRFGSFGSIEPLALFQGFEVMDHMVHVPDGPGPFLFRSDIGDDALAPISVGRGPSMALPWAIPILLPAARHVIGAVARMPIPDSWPVVQSCFSTCPSMTGRHCPCLP